MKCSIYGCFFFTGYLISQHRHALRRFATAPTMVMLLIGSSVFAALLVLQEHGLALGGGDSPGTNDDGPSSASS